MSHAVEDLGPGTLLDLCRSVFDMLDVFPVGAGYGLGRSEASETAETVVILAAKGPDGDRLRMALVQGWPVTISAQHGVYVHAPPGHVAQEGEA